MQFMKGSCCSDISRLTHKRALIFLRKYCKYLIKFQTFCQIECRNCKTFLKACAVSVQIRQTFFYIKSFFSQNFLQKKPHMFCFFLCTQDNRCCFIFFFAEFQSFCNLFRSMARICNISPPPEHHDVQRVPYLQYPQADLHKTQSLWCYGNSYS